MSVCVSAVNLPPQSRAIQSLSPFWNIPGSLMDNTSLQVSTCEGCKNSLQLWYRKLRCSKFRNGKLMVHGKLPQMSPLRGPPTHNRDAHREDTRSAHPALHRRRRFWVPADGNWDSPDLESKRNELVETTLQKKVPIHYKHVQRDEIFQRYKMMLKSLAWTTAIILLLRCLLSGGFLCHQSELFGINPGWNKSLNARKETEGSGAMAGWKIMNVSFCVLYWIHIKKTFNIFTQSVQNKFFSAGEGWWFHHSLFWYLHAITPSPPLGSNVWTER